MCPPEFQLHHLYLVGLHFFQQEWNWKTYRWLPEVPIPPAGEARPALSIVSGERAEFYTSPVTVYTGRASVIDFSRIGQVITYAQLSDISGLVYDTNAPIQSGAARIIVLRPIQTLFIEGTTTATVPNLVVTTVDTAGNPYTYIFNIYRDSGRPGQTESNGIAIAPVPEVRQTRLLNNIAIRPNVVRTELGGATLNDIARGLDVAIERGYTPPNDPVVFQVREAIAKARNGVPIRTAAGNLGLDIAVLTRLGAMGVEEGIVNPPFDPRGELGPAAPGLQPQPLEPPIYDIELDDRVAPLTSTIEGS